MAESKYEEALDLARKELMDCVLQQEAIDQKVAKLRHTIAALELSCGLQPTNTFGITDAVLDVLRIHSGRSLQPTAIKLALDGVGYDFSRYQNPLAVIHTTLKRLAPEVVRRKDGGYVLKRKS